MVEEGEVAQAEEEEFNDGYYATTQNMLVPDDQPLKKMSNTDQGFFRNN